MNKKHGIVATAWMLGGSWLFHASATVEAQVIAPPQNGSAPRVVYDAKKNTKKAPGLLPDFLRNSSKPANGTIVRPVVPPSAGAMNSTHGATPLPAKVVKPGVVQPVNHQLTSAAQQPANATTQAAPQQPSAVQQQLEELYRRDGRQMPAMNLQQMPMVNAGQSVAAPKPQNGHVVPAKPASKPGLLSRLNPFKSKQTSVQRPPQPRPNQMANGAGVRSPNGQPGVQPPAAPPVSQYNGPVITPAQPAVPAPPEINPAAGARAVVAPAANAAAAAASELSDKLPPVPGDADYKGPVTDAAEKGTAAVEEALENAFNDMPQDAGDGKAETAEAPKTNSATKDESPFSGLSLDDPADAAKEAPANVAKETKAKAPEFDELKFDDDEPAAKPAASISKSIEPTETASQPMNPGKLELSTEAASDAELPLPPEPAKLEAEKSKLEVEKSKLEVEKSNATEADDEVSTKMQRIAERGDLRGLKGFCAVALRDERDLKNALPEHTSTYKGRTYYFSSAEAKEAFDQQPESYAPAAGGIDVVLQKEKVSKEGSLDHAVWYKDRLYLFTSPKTLEQFVATPSEFAVNE